MNEQTQFINPLAMRVWFPRIVPDRDFDQLCAQLGRARINRVYLFDNGYMDNYQLADDVLAERVSVLTRRIAQLKELGVVAGINSGATIGHGGVRGFAENWHGRLDFQWWIDVDGSEAIGNACPIDPRFLAWVRGYFARLATTGATEIFIDDDLRPWNHPPIQSCVGCVCPLHLERFNLENHFDFTRETLVTQLVRPIPDRTTEIQAAWQRLLQQSMLEVSRCIERAVHEIAPSVRVGHMSAQNFILPLGADCFRQLVETVSAGHRPLLRTHNFHGSPREIHPGAALYVKEVAPADTEHLVEIENCAHNFHDFVRSPRETRYAILAALATGMGGASLNILGNDPPELPWEKRYIDMLAESDHFFRAVSHLTQNTKLRGVPIYHPAYNRQVEAIDHSLGSPLERSADDAIAPERLLSSLGLPFEWVENEPALLTGWMPRALGEKRLRRTLERGALIDSTAARVIHEMGLGDLLGVRVGEAIRSYAAIRYDDPTFCGPFAGQHVPLRRAYESICHLKFDPAEYREVTTLIRAHQRERVAPGVIVRCDGGPRIAVTPYPMRAARDEQMILVTHHHRYLLAKLFGWVMDEPVPVWIDSTAHVSPYFLKRASDSAVILSLFNPLHDELADVEIVFGDERLKGRSIERLNPRGELKPWRGPGIQWDRAGGRLRFDPPETLPACDVTVLIFR